MHLRTVIEVQYSTYIRSIALLLKLEIKIRAIESTGSVFFVLDISIDSTAAHHWEANVAHKDTTRVSVHP